MTEAVGAVVVVRCELLTNEDGLGSEQVDEVLVLLSLHD